MYSLFLVAKKQGSESQQLAGVMGQIYRSKFNKDECKILPSRCSHYTSIRQEILVTEVIQGVVVAEQAPFEAIIDVSPKKC